MLETNERVVLKGNGPLGKVWYCPVAAAGVGAIKMNRLESLWNKDLKQFTKSNDWKEKGVEIIKQGEEVGLFKLGSTVVLVVEVPVGFKFLDVVGKKVRYGDLIGRIDRN